MYHELGLGDRDSVIRALEKNSHMHEWKTESTLRWFAYAVPNERRFTIQDVNGVWSLLKISGEDRLAEIAERFCETSPPIFTLKVGHDPSSRERVSLYALERAERHRMQHELAKIRRLPANDVELTNPTQVRNQYEIASHSAVPRTAEEQLQQAHYAIRDAMPFCGVGARRIVVHLLALSDYVSEAFMVELISSRDGDVASLHNALSDLEAERIVRRKTIRMLGKALFMDRGRRDLYVREFEKFRNGDLAEPPSLAQGDSLTLAELHGKIRHIATLNYHDYYTVLPSFDEPNFHVFAQVTDELQSSEISSEFELLDKVACKSVGLAIRRWVQRGYAELTRAYPGMAMSNSRHSVINRLYAAAYNRMVDGCVVDFGMCDAIESLCNSISIAAKEWVERVHFEAAIAEPARGSGESTPPNSYDDGVPLLNFDFEELVGQGAEGDLWRCFDSHLNRPVAIKLLRASVAENKTALDHAQALARARHPNVVTVHTVGRIIHPKTGNQVDAIVMEFLEGSTLQQKLNGPRFSLKELDAICFAVLDGLSHIHGVGLAHGDLHEGNVIVTDREIKIIDPLYTDAFSIISATAKEFRLDRDLRFVQPLLYNALCHSEFAMKRAINIGEAIRQVKTLDEIEYILRRELVPSPAVPLRNDDTRPDAETIAALLTGNEWRLIFNPPDRSKPIKFEPNGQISAGQNHQENWWRIIDGKLEIMAANGRVFSRFSYDEQLCRFDHTNDRDTSSIRGQFIELDT